MLTDSPPVRYSVGQDDFNPEIGKRLAIYCDGVMIEKVIEYDCDAGTVLRFKRDDNGLILLNEKRDEALTETLRGKVMAEWKG